MPGKLFRTLFQGPDEAPWSPAALDASALLGNSFLADLLRDPTSANGSEDAVGGLAKPLKALTGGILPTKATLTTGTAGTHLGEAPKPGEGRTQRVVVDPTSATSLQSHDRTGAGGTSAQLDLGKTTVGGKAAFENTRGGLTETGQIGLKVDHQTGGITLDGALGRKTARDPSTAEHSEARAVGSLDPRDYQARGSVGLARDGDLRSGSMSVVRGAGRDARGLAGGFDRDKGTVSVGGTYGSITAGATVSDHSVGVQLGNGKIGGGAMVDWEGDRLAFGANAMLSKRFGVNAAFAMGEDDWYAGAGATYMGFGGGIGYGETNGRLTRGADAERAHSTVEHGHVANANLALVVAQGEGAYAESDHHTASHALPAGFGMWTQEARDAFLADLDARARGIRSASDLDLDGMDVGAGHRFDHSETLSGEASADLGFLPGTTLEGRIGGSTSDRSTLGIERSDAETWEVRDGRTGAGTSDMSAAAGMFFGAIGGSVGSEGSHAEGAELAYTISGDAGKEAFEATRLRLGVLPGAESHPDFAELEQLAAAADPSVEQQARLHRLRRRINGEVEARTEVGGELADGVQLQSRTRRAHEASTRTHEGRFLFWSSSSKTHTTSDTVSVDALGGDGDVERSELETRTRKEGDRATEQVRALTTTDDGGPAIAFDAQQRLSGSDHLYNARQTANADLLPGEAAMESITERLVETRVSLSRADTAAIAAELGKEGSTHWADLGARVSGLQDELLFGSVLHVPTVDGPDAFDRLSEWEQDRWLMMAQQASLGEGGNLFDVLPAIERIADPERQRAAYEDLVLDHRDGNAKQLANGDIGSEYLEFATSMRERTGGAIDLARNTATATTTEGRNAVKPTDDPAEVASNLGLAHVVFAPSEVVDTLTVAQRTGGPELVAEALAAQRLSPVLLHQMVSGDERQLQALLEATSGTEYGAKLVNVAAAAASMGPDAGTFGRMYLEAVAGQPASPQEAKPVTSPHERRGRALQRNLRIPGTSAIVASTLMEAAREGGPDAVAQALAAGSLSLEQVRAKAEADGDFHSLMMLRMLD